MTTGQLYCSIILSIYSRKDKGKRRAIAFDENTELIPKSSMIGHAFPPRRCLRPRYRTTKRMTRLVPEHSWTTGKVKQKRTHNVSTLNASAWLERLFMKIMAGNTSALCSAVVIRVPSILIRPRSLPRQSKKIFSEGDTIPVRRPTNSLLMPPSGARSSDLVVWKKQDKEWKVWV